MPQRINLAVARMEETVDWLDSPNPLLRQIAQQTFDDLLIPTIKAHLEYLDSFLTSRNVFIYPPRDRLWHELVALLVLSGDFWLLSGREWMRSIFEDTVNVRRESVII